MLLVPTMQAARARQDETHSNSNRRRNALSRVLGATTTGRAATTCFFSINRKNSSPRSEYKKSGAVYTVYRQHCPLLLWYTDYCTIHVAYGYLYDGSTLMIGVAISKKTKMDILIYAAFRSVGIRHGLPQSLVTR